ncbi:PRD domain-containing protein [Metabacillus herbersteinensis]|uniref:PRD domain-containing protein n=1 Tax=Metabacillus herbersteinensis TaxID=283816 RepID=A0ABV6GG33_9BACI
MEELYQKSEDPGLCKALMLFMDELLKRAKIQMTNAQKLSLLSHVTAMVYRSNHKEMIQPIDKTLFEEVSNESIEMANKVCGRMPDLHEDEKYLLSIHFESAKITN